MQILLRVDQSAALKRGIDAPQSTTHLEVDPAELTEIEREVLADVIEHGHDCTGRGLLRDGHTSGRTLPLLLVESTVDGLRSAIKIVVAERASYQADARQANAERRVRVDAEIEKAINPRTEKCAVHWVDGEPSLALPWNYEGPAVTVDLPVVPYVYPTAAASEEMLTRFERAQADVAERRAELVAATAAELGAEAARLEKEAAEKEAAEKVEYDSLYARLPALLRDRDAGGYSSTNEIVGALRKLLRIDAGYAGHNGWSDSHDLETLTDPEFVRLGEIIGESPEGASVTPREVWDGGGFRSAEEDEYEEADSDGEIEIPRENVRRLAVIIWSRGGVEAMAVVPLG